MISVMRLVIMVAMSVDMIHIQVPGLWFRGMKGSSMSAAATTMVTMRSVKGMDQTVDCSLALLPPKPVCMKSPA
jgi:hypothetical protein